MYNENIPNPLVSKNDIMLANALPEEDAASPAMDETMEDLFMEMAELH